MIFRQGSIVDDFVLLLLDGFMAILGFSGGLPVWLDDPLLLFVFPPLFTDEDDVGGNGGVDVMLLFDDAITLELVKFGTASKLLFVKLLLLLMLLFGDI